VKALILTEGGDNIGLGHVTRCTAIYQGLLAKGIDVRMIINGDDIVKKVLDDIDCTICDWSSDSEQLFNMLDGVGAVLIDSYLADKDAYSWISKAVESCFYIDDFNRIEYPKGVVLNASLDSAYLDYQQRDDITYLLGREYVILRKPFWSVGEKTINKEVKSVMITFGGLDYSKLADDVSGIVKKVFAQAEIDVVDPKKCFMSASQVRDLMIKTDICICAGGQTTYELARCGVPTIGVCLADNQLVNLEGWQREGFMDYIGRCDDGDMQEKLTTALKNIMPQSERKKRSQVGQRSIGGNGVVSIAEKLVSLSEVNR